MKERNLLYFITAVTATLFLIIQIIIRFMPWFNLYGIVALLPLHHSIIPVIVLWLAWYFEEKGLLLTSTAIFTVLLGLHMNNSGILSGTPYVISQYAPMVRTVYVLGFLVLLGTVGIGYYSYLKKPTTIVQE
ncbi:MAG: hypothetical protein CVV61_02690 [Tenericutes bacterium HGW-Tenericutes-6]|jgi:preprotein translocase subunit SecG|nr:MAG: hypothetical protein CVV61_02690 [Tenericutes bacterium HGW-Tenericutes-6]